MLACATSMRLRSLMLCWIVFDAFTAGIAVDACAEKRAARLE